MDGRLNKHGRMAAALGVILAFAGAVHADLMPISYAEDGVQGERSTSAPSGYGASVIDGPLAGLTGLGALAAEATGSPLAGMAEDRPVQILEDRSNSLHLCLYALISLGVFRSCRLVKISSLGFVPEWYHSGAPEQIGHSYAVGPDAVCFAAVCFVQPEGGVDPAMPRQRRDAITALWRCSQFTPFVLACRAPPRTS